MRVQVWTRVVVRPAGVPPRRGDRLTIDEAAFTVVSARPVKWAGPRLPDGSAAYEVTYRAGPPPRRRSSSSTTVTTRVGVPKPRTGPHPCPIEGCGRVFDTGQGLAGHEVTHYWVDCGCGRRVNARGLGPHRRYCALTPDVHLDELRLVAVPSATPPPVAGEESTRRFPAETNQGAHT